MQQQPKVKKYICPNCNAEISNIRFTENAICRNVLTKCKKCGKIIEIVINSLDK